MHSHGQACRAVFLLAIVGLVLPITTALVDNNHQDSSLTSADGAHLSRVRARRSYGHRRRQLRFQHQQPGDVMMSDATGSRNSPPSGFVRCGEVDIDPDGALCCDGLVYSRRPGSDMHCCDRVAYDATHFACCGPRQRSAVVRRTAVMPSCCDPGSNQDCPRGSSGGLGSICCRSASNGGRWRCCLRGERCCDGARAVVDVPGYRPACCQADTTVAAQCCAQTYERAGALPQCCDHDRVRPICCNRPDGSIECCPPTLGYCCGLPQRNTGSSAWYGQQQQQTDSAWRPSLRQHQQQQLPQPRTGTSYRYSDDRPQHQQPDDRDRHRTRDRHDDRYPTERMPTDRDRYDQRGRDRYQPQPTVPTVQYPPRNGNSTTLASIPATCCFNPSPRCCPQSSNVRQPACCRQPACRPASFSAARCPGQRSPPRCPPQQSQQCPPQGQQGPCCPPQGSGGQQSPCCPPQGQQGACC